MKYSLVMTQTPCYVEWLGALSLLGLHILHPCTYVLTYLLTQLALGVWNRQYLRNGWRQDESYYQRRIKSYTGFRLPPKCMTSERDSKSLVL